MVIEKFTRAVFPDIRMTVGSVGDRGCEDEGVSELGGGLDWILRSRRASEGECGSRSPSKDRSGDGR